MKSQEIKPHESTDTFSGNIYIFYAFDIGDDINIDQIEKMRSITKVQQRIPKYFKNYHVPLAIALPTDHSSIRCVSCKIHNFGALSLIYKIPFSTTLKKLHATLGSIAESFVTQSDIDARVIYKKIESAITHPNFSNMQTWYAMIQTNPQPHINEPSDLQKNHRGTIASLLRFETETLSEYQINDIWASAIGYFRGDLIIVDTEAAFVYDDEYEELLDLFEFANIQSLELHYFDRMLDEKLNAIYEGKVKQFPTQAYLPLISVFLDDPIERLGKTRVDISVITERLESTIKLAGEPYLSELHDLLVENLDLKSWQESIDRKLKIVESVQSNHQHKIETSREDLLSLLILILISIEVMVALLHA
jgi:hypothetical protein